MKCLLILDRYGYKVNDEKYREIVLNKYDEVEIIYTKYEDVIIRKVRNWAYIGNFLMHILRWIKSMKYALTALKYKNIDSIICLNPLVGFFLGLFNINNRKIIFAGFLFESKKNRLYYLIRKKLTKFSLKKIEKVVCYGSKEVQLYEKIFKLNNKFLFVPYGIDYMNQKNYKSKSLPRNYIFSGGSSNRDYKTLIDAYNLLNKKVPLIIATQPWRLEQFNTNNIIVLSDVVNETFGDVMKKSDLLILSLKDTEISAGHMVMLQAMSLSIPVLVNDIPAIRDYVGDDVVEFYTSGNYMELKDKIEECLSNNYKKEKVKKAKELYDSKYTSFALIKRLIDIY